MTDQERLNDGEPQVWSAGDAILFYFCGVVVLGYARLIFEVFG